MNTQTIWRTGAGVCAALLLLFGMVWGATPAAAQDIQLPIPTPPPNLSEEAVEGLVTLYYRITTVQDLAERAVLIDAQAETETQTYLAQAAAISPNITNIETLISTLERYDAYPDAPPNQPSVVGLFNFVNIVWVVSSVMIVIAVVGLFRQYVPMVLRALWRLLRWLLTPLAKLFGLVIPTLALVVMGIVNVLRRIPRIGYEVLAYLICLGVMALATQYAYPVGQFVALPSLLGLTFAIGYSLAYRLRKLPNQDTLTLEQIQTPIFGAAAFMCLVTASNAIYHQSSILGFLAVIYLQASLGFSVLVGPLCAVFGFWGRDVIARSMIASLTLLIVYVTAQLTNLRGTYFDFFAPGVYFMGTFVYFAGLLVVTVRYYADGKRANYWAMQVLAVVSGLAAVFIGSVWQISQLLGIGGTFFAWYLIGRYIELLDWKRYWVWALLGLGLILYVGSWFVTTHPQFFVFW
jgi:hypothetical protein